MSQVAETNNTSGNAPDSIRNVVILGSGPAGLTAAIYAARANMNPLVMGGLQPGGQLMITTDVENFPGFADPIEGPDLMLAMENQAKRVGAEVTHAIALKVDLSHRPFTIETNEGQTIQTKTLIIATGASAKWLGLPSETALYNKGVSACATCDGFFFKGKDVVVVGGGDTALEEAMYLARLCKSVTLIHRRDTLRASKIMQDRALKNEKIHFLWDTIIKDILDPSEGKVTGIRVINIKTDEEKVIPTDAVFVAIGHKPNTDLFKGQLDLDDDGYLCVTTGTRTGIPGVFASGDVHDTVYRQAVTAAGTGCMAAIDATRFIEAEEAEEH
ncbi:MAG: thioredoxin-disulfide reductase [Cytophagales bacterium]|nr:thioredoxin-disulfide reductase [Armatimonadota bacterium]